MLVDHSRGEYTGSIVESPVRRGPSICYVQYSISMLSKDRTYLPHSALYLLQMAYLRITYLQDTIFHTQNPLSVFPSPILLLLLLPL